MASGKTAKPQQSPTAHILNSGVLLKIAKDACARIGDVTDTDGGKDDAIVSILLSAAAVEAFVMELPVFARPELVLRGNPRLQTLVTALEEAEASRGSTRLKYILAKGILSGTTYDKGAEPFQGFDALFGARDAIMHLKPDSVASEPKLLQYFRSRGLVAKKNPKLISSWICTISTRAVARWACEVAEAMIESIRNSASSEESPFFALTLGSRT